MAEERDPKLTQHYRELGREEPPRELDQTILAAAHRAADKAHAPLVTPAGRHRWYFAFGAAAVLVLAVGVAVHVERDRPDMEAASVPQSPAPVAAVPEQRKAKEESREARDDAAVATARSELKRQPAEAAPKREPSAEESWRQRTGALSAASETPERWLERIVELRKAGRHDEADRALAEFRERYPDYRVSAEMLEKVEREKK
jgi:hypothetical protein